jgi:hypothetical protein
LRWHRLLAALLAAAPLGGHALEKCVGADGKISYSDRGCPASAKRSSVGADTSLAGVRMEYYDVASPGGHMGRTEWHLSYTYRPRAGTSGCAVASVDTKLDLKVRLPRLTAPGGGERQQRWDRYLAGLQAHEAGHVQIARDFESNLKRNLLGVAASDCGSLDQAVRSRFDQMLQQTNQRDRDYDAQTNGGATQGARF